MTALNVYDRKNITTTFESSVDVSSGEVTLNSNQNNVIVIDINFTGNAIITSNLPTGCFMYENQGRLLLCNLLKTRMPEKLFSFVGLMNINTVKLYTKNSSSLASVNQSTNNFNSENNTWSGLNSNWQEYIGDNIFGENNSDLDETLNRIKKTGKSLIFNNNIGSDPNNFTKMGQNFDGDVYVQNNGVFVDKNGQIVKPRYDKKRLKNILRNKFRR